MFTYKAIGGAAFVLSYAVLLYLFPGFDLVAASLIAMLVGTLCWLMLWYLATRMNGLCIEFDYSRSRPGLSERTLWRGLKKLGYVEINMSLDGLGKPKVNETQVITELNYFFEWYLNALTSVQVVHFVGCQKDDADKCAR
jgi:uncharacterized membrane protein YraQ (UPF0718 family)